MGLINTTPFFVTAGGVFDISGASYDGFPFSVAADETAPQGLAWKPDGTRFFIVGDASTGPGNNARQYDTLSPWVLTGSSSAGAFDVSGTLPFPSGLFFKSDGTAMYIIESGFAFEVVQYTLSTAWDVTSASLAATFGIGGQDAEPRGVAFKPDGTKMYVAGNDGNKIYQYTLSTPWSISTASYDSVSFSVVSQTALPQEVQFSSDGTKMFVSGPGPGSIYQYLLSVAWNISTAVFDTSLNVSAQENSPHGFTFKADGTKLYVIGVVSDSIHQYSL